MKEITTFILVLLSMNLYSQEVRYNFNDCGLSEASGAYEDATTSSTLDCECGVFENAVYLDGNLDNIIFEEGIDSLLEQDFTLSFYFRMDDNPDETDIFSLRGVCSFDSFLSFRYVPIQNLFRLDLASNLGTNGNMAVGVDNSLCWHKFSLTKSGLLYTLYVDGQSSTFLSSASILFAKSARASFANSPCLAINETRFNGWIDEFSIETRALTSVELTRNDLRPDQVLTNDTTIVAGENVDIFTGPTCSSSWSWSPSATIINPSDLDITVNPEETTTYTIELNYNNGCIASDDVTVYVVDEESLDCEKILLPNAFTPNGDNLNDTYGISNLFLVENISYFEIYDRWGAKVWETAQKEATWDGMVQGVRANPAMYLYKIKYSCKGEEYVKVDNFSVMR